MATEKHRTEIGVHLDDAEAQKHMDALLQKAREYAELMGNVRSSRGSATTSTATSPGGTRRSDQPTSTTSTAGGGGGGKAPPARDAQYGLAYRTGSAAADYIQGGGMAFAGGRNDPAWAVKQTGRILEEVMERTSQGMLELANSIDLMGGSTPIVSDIIGAVATGLKISKALAAVGMTITAEAVEARMDKIMALQQMERPGEMGRVMGGYDLPLNQVYDIMAERWGFQAGEVNQMGAQFAHSIGAQHSLNGANMDALFKMTLSGINTSIAGQYMGLGGQGGGALQSVGGAFGALGGAIGTAEKAMGMRGSKTDEVLARIAAHTRQMAESGLHIDLTSINKMALGLHNAGRASSRQSGGPNPFAGMGGFRGALKLSQMGAGAAHGFSGQFGGLADAAIQAYAFQNADNPLDAIALMEKLASDPDMVRQVVGGMLGPQAGALAFAGKGFSAAQAKVLADPKTRAARGTPSSYGGASADSQKLNRAFAREEGKLLRAVDADPDNINIQLIRAMYMINNTLVTDLSVKGADMVLKLDAMARWLAGK